MESREKDNIEKVRWCEGGEWVEMTKDTRKKRLSARKG